MTSRYEESILRSLRRMARAVDLHSKRLAKQHELTGPQLVCLRAILRQEIATPSGIASAVSLSQATVTGILDRLEARKLVTRRRSENDRRYILVEITALGRELVALAPSPLHERFSARLAALHEGEQAMVDWVMQRVVALMEAEGVDAAPMMMSGPATADAGDVMSFLDAPQRADGDESPADGSEDDET